MNARIVSRVRAVEMRCLKCMETLSGCKQQGVREAKGVQMGGGLISLCLATSVGKGIID